MTKAFATDPIPKDRPLTILPAPQHNRALVALGANLPFDGMAPDATLRAAISALQNAGFADLQVSRFYATPCFPPGAGPDYVNAAVSAHWPGTAAQALAALHSIESSFGRERLQRWGMRTLDLDLIALGDHILPDAQTHAQWVALPPDDQRRLAPDGLILPHPRLQDRGFVLVPLADIAPNWCHPLTGQSVTQMLAALDSASLTDIRPLPGQSGDSGLVIPPPEG